MWYLKEAFLLILTAFTFHTVIAQQVIDSSYANGYYKQRLAFFRQLPNQRHEVVFLGNSITEAGEWQELFSYRKGIINRGISGDISFGVLARLDEVLASKPAQIFLLIGINDLKRGIPQELLLDNYEKIIKMIQQLSPKTKLIVQSILPVNKSMLSTGYQNVSNAKISKVNTALEVLTQRYKVQYLDLHPLFKNQQGELEPAYTTDGLHLQMPAYVRWVNHIKKQHLL